LAELMKRWNNLPSVIKSAILAIAREDLSAG
jgi:non-heme chloroperoxidase